MLKKFKTDIAVLARKITRRKAYKGKEVQGAKEMVTTDDGKLIIKTKKKYYVLNADTLQFEDSEGYISQPSKKVKVNTKLPR